MKTNMSAIQLTSAITVIAICLCLSDTALAERFVAESAVKSVSQELSKPASEITVHHVNSPFQSGRTRIHILPPRETTPPTPTRFLYLLPVEKQNGKQWGDPLNEVLQHDLHNKYGLTCVYATFSDLPWYANHPTDPQIQQERHLIEFVIPFVEARLPVKPTPDARLLIGFSKSGYGAWSLLLRHPNVFGKAAAWDSPLMVSSPNQFGMGAIFGSENNFRGYQIPILIANSGKQLGTRPRLIHAGHSNFHQHHEEANELLEELRIPTLYQSGPFRKHHWNSGWLPQLLPLLMATDAE